MQRHRLSVCLSPTSTLSLHSTGGATVAVVGAYRLTLDPWGIEASKLYDLRL